MILNYTYLNNTNHTYFKAKLLIILFLAHMGSIVSKTIVEDRQITSKTQLNVIKSDSCCLLREEEQQSNGLMVYEALLSKKDRRTRNLAINNYPFDCILRLIFVTSEQQDETATGFLIAENIVCTAGHFLRDYQMNLSITSKKIQILDHKGHLNLSQVVLHSKEHKNYYYPSQRYNNNHQLIEDDFGIIILNQPIKREKYLTVGLNYSMLNCPGTICGFPSEKQYLQKNSWLEQHLMVGRLVSASDIDIQYDIDTTSGQSGSAVLIQLIKGDFFVIGIHSGGCYYHKKVGDKKIKDALFKRDLKINPQLYEKDSYNSACKFTSQNLNEISMFINDNFSSTTIPFIKTVDLTGVNLTYPMEYYDFQVNTRKDLSFSQELKSCIVVSEIDVRQSKPMMYLKKARHYYKKQENHKSLIYCEQILKDPKGIRLVQAVQLYNLLGLNYQSLSCFDLADSFYKISMELALKVPESNPLVFAQVCSNIGTMYLQSQNSVQAYQIFQNAQQRLRIRNNMNSQHYAATLINLALSSHQTHQLKDIAINKLIRALHILDNISTSNRRFINGKILALRTLLRFLFQEQRFEEWISFIIHYFQIIILIKLKAGVYDDDKGLQQLRKRCSTKSNDEWPDQSNAQIYKDVTKHLEEIDISSILINPEGNETNVTIKIQEKEKTITTKNYLKQYHPNYESFNELILNQFGQIFKGKIQNGSILFKVSLIFNEIFKGMECQKVEEIRMKISQFITKYFQLN